MELYYSVPFAFSFIGLRFMFHNFVHFCATGEKTKVNLFSESSFKCLYHATAFCIGYNYVLQENLLNNIQTCWTDIERQHIVDHYYLFELSWYLHELICHFFTERKKDHLAMLIHHAATITLIILSDHYNLLFIGTLITTVHNLSDIFLHSAKMFSYMQSDLGVNACIFLLFVSWIYSRLYIFPMYIIHTCINDTQFLIDSGLIETSTYYIANSALITLFLLHIFWFNLLCVSIARKFRGETLKDPRDKSV